MAVPKLDGGNSLFDFSFNVGVGIEFWQGVCGCGGGHKGEQVVTLISDGRTGS